MILGTKSNMSFINSMIDAYSNFWWGIMASLLVVAIIFVIIAVLQDGKKKFSPLSWLVGGILAIFLTFQLTYLIGAIQFKMDCKETAEMLNDLLPRKTLASESENIRESLHNLSEEFPIIEFLFDADFVGDNLTKGITGDAIFETINSKINGYITRKVIWSVLACGVAITLIFLSMERIRQRRTALNRRSASSSEGRRLSRRR